MAEQDIKMDMKKILSDKGKEHVFNAIKEYIDAKIDAGTSSIMTKELRDVVEKRAAKAEEDMYSVIMGLEWRAI